MAAPELVAVLENLAPGRALDLACGKGRHARWLVEHGWSVTGIDIDPAPVEGVKIITADLERAFCTFEPNPECRFCTSEPNHTRFCTFEPNSWDLIISWLYWQPSLIPTITAAIKPTGVVAMAGKVTGRFAVSLDQLKSCFPGWQELAAGEDGHRCFFIARRI